MGQLQNKLRNKWWNFYPARDWWQFTYFTDLGTVTEWFKTQIGTSGKTTKCVEWIEKQALLKNGEGKEIQTF